MSWFRSRWTYTNDDLGLTFQLQVSAERAAAPVTRCHGREMLGFVNVSAVKAAPRLQPQHWPYNVTATCTLYMYVHRLRVDSNKAIYCQIDAI